VCVEEQEYRSAEADELSLVVGTLHGQIADSSCTKSPQKSNPHVCARANVPSESYDIGSVRSAGIPATGDKTSGTCDEDSRCTNTGSAPTCEKHNVKKKPEDA
jgi:hypothetical protein